jgi:hypothetical protein
LSGLASWFAGIPLEAAPVTLEPSAVEALKSLVLGFAFAGLLASAFELFTQKRAGFELLQSGGVGAVASVPVVVFSAPFLILRNTVRGRRIEGRPFFFVMAASMIASLWSLISGRVVLDLLMMLGAA